MARIRGENHAFGWPGLEPRWTHGDKDGMGTAYSAASRIWFTEADQNAALLQQVRAALQRIENGNYGKCHVDGGPIGEKRLKQMPWAVYCLKHQQELEQASPPPATL